MKNITSQEDNLNKTILVTNKPVIYALMGPTCTFKSKIGIELAKKFPFEIVSADSRLVYRGMDIGTSKPTQEERNEVPHFMIDLIEPNAEYTVGLYKIECEKKINDIFSRDKTPLLVGGTGLYLNSVLLGLSIPEVKPDLSFRRQLKQFTQEEIYQNLKKLDSKAAETIHKNDNFRTIRALEVIYKTNKLFSKLKTLRELPFKVKWIGLTYRDRERHAEMIKDRAIYFCKNGLVEEVSSLVEKYGELELFKNTIGYKEIVDFLKGRIKLYDAIEKITLHTKQLVKKQMTWFRANKNINWIDLDDISYEDSLKRVFSLIEEGSLAKTSSLSIS